MFELFRGIGSNVLATHISTKYLFNGFTLLGMNTPNKWKPLYYLYSAIINISVILFLPFAFNMSYMLKSAEMSATQLLTSIQVAINVCGLPVKIITIKLHLNRLRNTETIMDALDERCHLKEEFRKIRKCIIIGNRLAVFFAFAYGMYSVSTFLTSVIMGQPPYSLFMPGLNWRRNKWEFAVQAFIEFMLMNFTCLHQAMEDVYAVIYIYILRTHMQILVDRVKRLGSDENKSKETNYKELVQCIKDHQQLLSLLDLISPLISITIFLQFAITAAILGTTMINIFIFADTSAKIASAVYFLAVLVQTSPCCYQATCLMYDSEQLPLAILQCNWIDKDKRFRQMLIFFMQRSQISMSLTAMKLFPINLNTNISIAKFSFSLYTLIKNMDFGQNF